MVKKIFILGLIIVMLAFNVYAIPEANSTNNIVAFYAFDSIANSLTDYASGYNLTVQRGAQYRYINETLSYWNFLDNGSYLNVTFPFVYSSFTYVLYLNDTSLVNSKHHLNHHNKDNTDEQNAMYYSTAGTGYRVTVEIDDDPKTTDAPAINKNQTFRQIAVTYNGSQVIHHSEGVAGTPVAQTQGATDYNRLVIGSNRDIDNYFAGGIAAIYIYNSTLTTSHLSALSSEGIKYNPFVSEYIPPNNSINIILNLPKDNSIHYINEISFSYNATVDGLTIENCSIYINDTLNYTNFSVVSGINSSFQIGLNEGVYKWDVSCWGNNSAQYNSSSKTFTVLDINDLWTNMSYLNTNIGSNVTINCNSSGSISSYITINISNNIDNTSFLTNITEYTINNSDFYDNISFRCEECIGLNCFYGNEVGIDKEVIDLVVNINIRNSYGDLIPNIKIDSDEFSKSYTSNPTTIFLSDFTNFTNKSKTTEINITDLTYENVDGNFNVTFEENNNSMNLTLNPNQLYLLFYQNGVATTTQGFVSDLEKTLNFSNTSLIVIQRNLTNGRVGVYFGQTQSQNHTQIFEYINDYTTNIKEDLEVLIKADATVWLKVTDYTNAPLEDVIIRIETASPSVNFPNWTYHGIISQRLSKDDGYTYFWCDSQQQVNLFISKEGYNEEIRTFICGDEAFSRESPLEVYLQEADNSTYGADKSYVAKKFYNRSLDIFGNVWSMDVNKLEINTNYRVSQGLGRKDITNLCDSFYRCSFTLVSGTDFSNSGTDDIELYIYKDSNLWKNITLEYDDNIKTNIFDSSLFESIDNDIFLPLIAIMLVLICGAIGMVFSNENIGIGIFKIGALIISLIEISFIWVSVVILMDYTFRLIKKVISE